MQQAYNKIKLAREINDEKEELFWLGRILNYLLVFEPVEEDEDAHSDKTDVVWNFK